MFHSLIYLNFQQFRTNNDKSEFIKNPLNFTIDFNS